MVRQSEARHLLRSATLWKLRPPAVSSISSFLASLSLFWESSMSSCGHPSNCSVSCLYKPLQQQSTISILCAASPRAKWHSDSYLVRVFGYMMTASGGNRPRHNERQGGSFHLVLPSRVPDEVRGVSSASLGEVDLVNASHGSIHRLCTRTHLHQTSVHVSLTHGSGTLCPLLPTPHVPLSLHCSC